MKYLLLIAIIGCNRISERRYYLSEKNEQIVKEVYYCNVNDYGLYYKTLDGKKVTSLNKEVFCVEERIEPSK